MSQKIVKMISSRTDEDLSIMVNSTLRTSRRRETQSRYKPNMQDLTSLMEFLGKDGHKYSSSTTRINDVSI